MFIPVVLTLLILCVTAFFRFVFPIRFLSRRKRCLLDRIPGPKPTFLLDNTLEFSTPYDELIPMYMRFYRTYGNVFKYITLGRPTVILSHYKDIEKVLSSYKYIDKSEMYRNIQPWLGTGLVTSTGKKWHSRRKILTPSFHFKILEENIPVVNENVRILLEKLTLKCQNDTPVDIRSLVSLCALDIICETAMGVSVNAQQGGSDYVKSLHRITYLIHHRIFHFWLWSDFMFSLSSTGKEHKKCLDVLHGFTDKVIQERRKEYKARNSDEELLKPGKKRLAFLDMLIEASERDGVLNDSDIREEVDTFMFGGHDTISTAISWALFLLGFHPEIQEKAYEELKEIFGDSDRLTTWEDLPKMKYLEQIIKEALRIYPSVPGFSRENTVDIDLGDYVILAGTEILFITYLIHRNEEVFPDPEKFNPDNFSQENCNNRNPFAYVPFSAGPRNCIGQKFAMIEEKIVLSSILRKFKLESCGRREDVVPHFDLVLKTKDPLLIKFYLRS